MLGIFNIIYLHIPILILNLKILQEIERKLKEEEKINKKFSEKKN